jgi:hypothetical protein
MLVAKGHRGAGADEQRGAILPLMAIIIMILMGAAAMAVDLGWLYWQSLEVQHGADAAALAGVVYEPDLRTQAHTEATAAAKENGYDDADANTTVEVIDFVDDSSAAVRDSMLRVTVSHNIDTFFMKIFGLDEVTISRTAVAEYVTPLALGSPESYFGDDPADEIYPGFVAKIDGSYIGKRGGDRFGALCLNAGFGTLCKDEDSGANDGGPQQGANPEGRQSSGEGTVAAQGGYLFAIEVEEGSSAGLTVEIFSAPLYAVRKYKNSSAPPTGTGNFLGDGKYRPGPGASEWTTKAITWYMLYGPDPTPSDTTDGNELLCSIAYNERHPTFNPGGNNPPSSSAYWQDFSSYGWDGTSDNWLEFDEIRSVGRQDILDAMWEDMGNTQYADQVLGNCASSFDKGPGTYVLRVFNQHDPTGQTDIRLSWRGSNAFSLRVSSSGATQPTVSAMEDMLISAARNTTQTNFFLAEVDEKYADKDLIIELWDVGDITSGPGTDAFTINDGFGNPVNCEWTATNTTDPSNETSGGPGDCTINASDKKFNNELITIIVAIPDSYTCTGATCWWEVEYDYSGLVKDTTTWTAYIDGNPIRIVE